MTDNSRKVVHSTGKSVMRCARCAPYDEFVSNSVLFFISNHF